MRGQKPRTTFAGGRDLSARAHRLLIGSLGLLLPVLLYVLAGLRSTTGLTSWRLLDSVSAYYYTGAIGVFIGVLFALSLFLFSYRGYTDGWIDRALGKAAGVAALGVPLFPTKAPRIELAPSWWTPVMNVVHLASAAVLFVSFIVFAVWLFRRSRIARFQDRPLEKRVRDSICLACGIVMILSMLWAASSLFSHAPIFWPETIAIEAFAISWLAKGEVHRGVVRVARFLTSGRSR